MTRPPRPVYLDWAATAPPLPAALDAFARAAAGAWGNPASVHSEGRRARALVEGARERVAELALASPRDVLLTSGTTEANNLALAAAPAVVTSRLEHPSLVRSAERAGAQGRPLRWLSVPPSGRLDPAAVAAELQGLPTGFVVGVSAASHETGIVHPVEALARVVRAAGGRLHVDAAQAAGRLVPELWALGDSIALGAHKLRGPKGIGALVVRDGPLPGPLLVGGSQERGLRPGTQDAAAAAGFAAALEAALDGGPARYAAVAPLRDRLERALAGRAAPNADEPRLAGHASLHFPGHLAEVLVAALDLEGICVSGGAACSAGTAEPAPGLAARFGEARAQASVRVSLGEATSAEDVELAIEAFCRVLDRSPGRS